MKSYFPKAPVDVVAGGLAANLKDRYGEPERGGVNGSR
jgi:hypothetical protein